MGKLNKLAAHSSHFSPTKFGLHLHFPDFRSHDRPVEPASLHSHGRQSGNLNLIKILVNCILLIKNHVFTGNILVHIGRMMVHHVPLYKDIA
jgi:hypothetical protein